MLELSGEGIATQIDMSGVLFGSTVLAAATSLPEVSTGLASVRMGDYQLAFGDIFGGNAFLPVLFLLAGLLSGQAVVPQAQVTDIYLTGLGALLSVVYMFGILFRPTNDRPNRHRLGGRSALYLLGIGRPGRDRRLVIETCQRRRGSTTTWPSTLIRVVFML